MKKPFLIVVLVCGELSEIRERSTRAKAIDIAAEIAAEQCDSSLASIKKELQKDGDFLSVNGDIRVYVSQSDKD